MKNNFSIFLLLTTVFLYSCQNEELIDNSDTIQNENFVNMDEAKAFASVLEHQATSKSGRTTSSTKEIESVLEVPDIDGNPSFYIVNYGGSGYIMLSADNRIEPIRAFSQNEHFSFDLDAYPSGLVEWLAGTSNLIHEARVLNIEQTESVALAWNICQMGQVMGNSLISDDECGGGGSGGGGGGCQDQYSQYGPLLTTTWGQMDGYNDLAPNLGCDNVDGKAFTGCVATAMAQVINYHQFPARYNYDDMPDNWGTISTAQLMRDVGDAVDMDWGCDGSGTNTENEVAPAFKNDFGYSSATYADFNHATVKQQIRWYRPVILKGGRQGTWFIFPTYEGGHA